MTEKMNRILSAIADVETAVVSFDVFDTLLVRPFWKPVDLFVFLDREASRLLGTSDIVEFSACRRTCEQRARAKAIANGQEDVTFDEIYDHIAQMDLFPPEVIHALKAREMELEMRFCGARESAAELVRCAHDHHKSVIAVSDMYLPSDFIRAMLEKNGICGIDRIFVSGETGLTKGSGHLYERVRHELGVEYRKIVHIGDNKKTDVYTPSRMGIRAFHFPRTIDLMAKGGNGAYRHAYGQLRSSISNYHAETELGLRCMLAVAANLIYDDPFKPRARKGDYAGDPELFGCLALGMYCLAQGLWVSRIAGSQTCDRVLFFSRDGHLPFMAYNLIREYAEPELPEAKYVRISRKALLPLLLTQESGIWASASHLVYYDHSPRSVAGLMKPVLRDDAEAYLQSKMGEGWLRAFDSEVDLMGYMSMLYRDCLDDEKARAVSDGFKACFAPLMSGKILTYDIGYSLRNEILLRMFFPEASINACFTHSGDDVSLKRGIQGAIGIQTFYGSIPYVSWLPRELFLTEAAPSCTGYGADGAPVLQTGFSADELIVDMQQHAERYMETFAKTFRDDITWLPLQPANACLPFETFLHSPARADRRWIKNLNADNAAASGLRQFKCYNFWRRLRVDYWAASHHLGRYGRYAVMFLLLLLTDRHGLATAVKKRLPSRLRRALKGRL